jgi:hypothetical protein
MKMRQVTHNALFCLPVILLGLTACQTASEQTKTPSTHARFVPERMDDFAWENDLIAFRAYGPALRENPENSGIDAWLKRVPYPIIDKWYRQHLEADLSYHEDHGEGLDNYKTGASAGCGGTGLWIEGRRVPLETFTRWEIHEQSTERTRFTLHYEKQVGGVLYGEAKTITIELGRRLYAAESTFTKDGVPAPDLEVCVGLTTGAGAVEPYWDAGAGWIATWGTLDDSELGTGVRMDPRGIDAVKVVDPVPGTENADGHILILASTDEAGRIRYEAGYGWKKAGGITSKDEWANYLSN